MDFPGHCRRGFPMNAVAVPKADLVGSFYRSQIPNNVFLCIILIYVLFVLDIVTTDMILSLGGFEVNHVMVPVVDNVFFHLLIKGFVLIFIVSVAQWSELKLKGSGLIMMLVITGWYSFVVMNNTSVLIHLCEERCPRSPFF
jgi:hypothetical protein